MDSVKSISFGEMFMHTVVLHITLNYIISNHAYAKYLCILSLVNTGGKNTPSKVLHPLC